MNPIDWNEIVLDLRRLDFGLTRVASCTGIPKTTIFHWTQGGEPKHSDGERLIGLWERVTGRPRDLLPRIVQPIHRCYVRRPYLFEIRNAVFVQNLQGQ